MKVTIAPAETISHFYRSSAQRSRAPGLATGFATEGVMSSPILTWALALSWDGERANFSPNAGGGKGLLAPRGTQGLQDPAWLGGKVGEEHGIGQIWVVARK